MAVTGKGAEGIDLAAAAMAQQMSAQVRNRRPCPNPGTDTASGGATEEPEQPPAPRDP